MRQVLSISVVLLCATSLVVAQEVTSTQTAGSRALLFSFGGLANLSANDFNGGIGAKYFLSEALAVRGGINFASASRTIPANPSPGNVGVDGSQSATLIGFNGGVEYRLAKGRTVPIVGGGISFQTVSTENKALINNVAPPPPGQTVTKNSAAGELGYQAGTTLSLFALAGFEFFLWKEISLSGEYRLGFSSTSRKDQEQTVANVTTTTKLGRSSTIGIAATGALTLAVYFN